MFFPQLFGIVGEKLVCTKDREYDDPEDLYDDRYLLEVRIYVLILFYGHFVTTETRHQPFRYHSFTKLCQYSQQGPQFHHKLTNPSLANDNFVQISGPRDFPSNYEHPATMSIIVPQQL